MKLPQPHHCRPIPTLIVGDPSLCPNSSRPAIPAASIPFGNPTAFRKAVSSLHIEEILILPNPNTPFSQLIPILSDASALAIPTRIPLLLHNADLPQEIRPFSNPSSFLLACKRAMDVSLSATCLILLSPLLALIAILIKLDSPGPVLFFQPRVGKHLHPFRLIKFRSMVANAEQLKNTLLHLNEHDGPTFKIHNDPRVTRVGRWLRKSSLDEVPQLWNVLRGEMSLVGPRPPLTSETNLYLWHHRKRLSVKPGLTCIWQISGRSNVPFERWMEMDLSYISHWSLWLDLKILLLTIPAVLTGRGAS